MQYFLFRKMFFETIHLHFYFIWPSHDFDINNFNFIFKLHTHMYTHFWLLSAYNLNENISLKYIFYLFSNWKLLHTNIFLKDLVQKLPPIIPFYKITELIDFIWKSESQNFKFGVSPNSLSFFRPLSAFFNEFCCQFYN